MSQREFLIVLAHVHVCSICRARLLNDAAGTLTGRSLTPEEKAVLERLQFDDFITPDTLARATGIAVGDLDAYRDEAVVRLRHV